MSADQDQWTVPTDFPPAEMRVRFNIYGNQLPNQSFPHEWAEAFCSIVFAEHPGVFRAILPRLYGLPEPEKRGRKP